MCASSSIQPPRFERVDCAIAQHFVSALIDGDTTGLEDREEHQLDCFVAGLTEDFVGGHWSVMTEESNYQHCAVTGLFSECVTVAYYYPTKKAA